MRSADLFDAGYAIPFYDISTATRTWRYRGEEYSLPFGAVWPIVELPGIRFPVAKIEDVRAAGG